MKLIEYRVNAPLSLQQFIDILNASTLGERRPVADRTCMQGMLDNAQLIVTAWSGERLVGVARSITDFHYVCYLSDLAVDREFHRQGIGKALQQHTLTQLQTTCKLVLLAAPAAQDYYAPLGYEKNERGWVLAPGKSLS